MVVIMVVLFAIDFGTLAPVAPDPDKGQQNNLTLLRRNHGDRDAARRGVHNKHEQYGRSTYLVPGPRHLCGGVLRIFKISWRAPFLDRQELRADCIRFDVERIDLIFYKYVITPFPSSFCTVFTLFIGLRTVESADTKRMQARTRHPQRLQGHCHDQLPVTRNKFEWWGHSPQRHFIYLVHKRRSWSDFFRPFPSLWP